MLCWRQYQLSINHQFLLRALNHTVPSFNAILLSTLFSRLQATRTRLSKWETQQVNNNTYREASFILCNARRAAVGEMKTDSGGSIMQTDTSLSRSLSLSLCLSRSRSLSRSRISLSLIADSLSCWRSLSFSPLLSRTLSRSRFLSRLRSRSWSLSHAVSPNGGKDGDAAKEIYFLHLFLLACLLEKC